jgi:hypothetical protein
MFDRFSTDFDENPIFADRRPACTVVLDEWRRIYASEKRRRETLFTDRVARLHGCADDHRIIAPVSPTPPADAVAFVRLEISEKRNG